MDLIFRHDVGDADVRSQAGGGFVAMKPVGPGGGATWAYEVVCSEIVTGEHVFEDAPADARCGARITRLDDPLPGDWECEAGHASGDATAAGHG